MEPDSFIYKTIQNVLNNKIEQKVKNLQEIVLTTDDLTSTHVVALSAEIDKYMVFLQKLKLKKSISSTQLARLLMTEFCKRDCKTGHKEGYGRPFLSYAYLTRFVTERFVTDIIDDNVYDYEEYRK